MKPSETAPATGARGGAPAAPPAAAAGRPRELQPPGWPQPRGYANGMMATGSLITTGGVVGWDVGGDFPPGLVAQVRQALLNIVAILAEGGAEPGHLMRLTWYVVDINDYRASLAELGRVYREVIGSHYPAMALVQVAGLVEASALVEIEATAVVAAG